LRNDIITIFVGFAKTIRRSFGFNLIKFTNKISPSQLKDMVQIQHLLMEIKHQPTSRLDLLLKVK
jgi:hypothetical protein